MTQTYTSFDRVQAALEHREPDRVPFDLGGSVLTGMNKVAYKNLRDHLGLTYLTEGRYEEAGDLFHESLAATPADDRGLLAQRHGCAHGPKSPRRQCRMTPS